MEMRAAQRRLVTNILGWPWFLTQTVSMGPSESPTALLVLRSFRVFRSSSSTEVRMIRARKTVMLSSGTLGTPLLLERLGVGSRKVLTHAGVDVVAHSPGSVDEFQGHNPLLTSYYTSLQPNKTMGDILNCQTTFQQLLDADAPILGWNAT